MTRLQLVEALNKMTFRDETTEKEAVSAIQAMLNTANVLNPAVTRAYTELQAEFRQLLADGKATSFSDLMTSDLSDAELQTAYDFMSSAVGQKWVASRRATHEMLMRLNERYTIKVGTHLTSVQFVQLQQYLLYIVGQLRPEWNVAQATAFIDVTLATNPLYTPNDAAKADAWAGGEAWRAVQARLDQTLTQEANQTGG
jgi:hypothetical protein